MLDDVKLLRRLDAAGADLNAQYPDRFNWTPLIASIYFESTIVSAYLINRGVDVCKRDRNGDTALTMAIVWDDTNTVALLFQKAGKAIRECEDWKYVWGIVQIRDGRKEWTKMLNKFGVTNTYTPD